MLTQLAQPILSVTKITEISPAPTPMPRLTGAIQFCAANIAAWGSSSNPRGYNDAGTPGLRQINTLGGAQMCLNWQLPMIPKAQLATTLFLFWCPGGDLSSILQQWPIDYASGLEMSRPGWDLIANTLAANGCTFGIACRPAEHNYGLADPTNPIHVLWLQRQIERCLKLFPAGAKRAWYCDTVNGGSNFVNSLGMLKHMRDFVGPDDLLLPECFNTPIDQMAQFLAISGGCYREMINLTGDTKGLSTADRATLQKQFPNSAWVTKDADGFSSTSAQKRAFGFVPMVGDYPGGAGLSA